MAGIQTLHTYEPDEIRGLLTNDYITLGITIEKGQNLDAGQVLGKRPTTGKYIAYNKDASASATSPKQKVGGNIGDGTCSEVDVQDNYTLTEDFTLTASNAR